MAAAPPSAPCTESKLLLAPVQNSVHWQMAYPLPPPTSASFSSRAAPVAIPCPVRAPAAAPAMSTTSLAATAVKAGAKPPPSLAAAWREIQGAGDWAGLVDPLHPLLREEILRYGELVAVCYSAFDLDPSSKRYHRCMYGRQSLLREAGPGDDCGYEVTRYVYAAPGVAIGACSRWVGYVAVAGDAAVRRLGRRDVVVGFRGTVTGAEWAASLMSSLVPARLDPHDPRPGVKVESGFLSLYTSDDGACRFGSCSCRQQLLSEVARLVNKHKDEEMSITLAGHSMGSALALLLAYDLAELGLNRPTGSQTVPVTVYSFGGPRVGNAAFKDRFDELGVKVLRVVNVNDPVTKLPGVFLNEGFEVAAGRCGLPWSGACYAHVGVELALDRFSWRRNPVVVHDMEAYIGLLKFPNPIVGRRKKKRDAGLLLSEAAKFFTEQKSSGEWRWRDAVAGRGGAGVQLGAVPKNMTPSAATDVA